MVEQKRTKLRWEDPFLQFLFIHPNIMSVQGLSAQQLRAAIHQILSSPGFGPANPHLSAAEIAAIDHGTWPAKPVFTPYAITHHDYSQSKRPP